MGNFEKTFVRFRNEMVFLAFILGGKHFCFHCTDVGECVCGWEKFFSERHRKHSLFRRVLPHFALNNIFVGISWKLCPN